MRHQRLYSLFLMFSFQPVLMLNAQTDHQQRLSAIATLERNGQPAAAIAAAKEFLGSADLTSFDQGKAWNVMGLAYNDEGDLRACQHAYEEALSHLQGDGDRAAVLDNLGEVYRETGSQGVSEKLRKKALELYTRIADHQGMAIADDNLASLAIARRQLSKAQSYLDDAVSQAKDVPSFDTDDMAGILSMQAYLDGAKGDLNTAITGYQHALALWRQKHGEDHPAVGWGEILLASAYDRAGHTEKAMAEVRRGLAILSRSPNQHSIFYINAQLAYANILDHAGASEEAMRVHSEAETASKDLVRSQCFGCTISIVTFQ